MSDSLAAAETRRAELLRSIANLRDMHEGSVVGAVWRCGKPTCHCAQPNDPGHGPNLRLTYETAARPSPMLCRLRRRYARPNRRSPSSATTRQLSRELVEVSEHLCRLRTCGGNADCGGKKTAEAVRQEVALEVDQILRIVFQDRRKSGRLDLEAIEMAVRSAMRSRRRRDVDRFTEVRGAGGGAAGGPLRLWSPGSLSRTPFQARADCSRPSEGVASPILFSPAAITDNSPPMSNWTSRRRSSPRCASHAGAGRPGRPVRSWPPADEDSGRFGGHDQSGGTHRQRLSAAISHSEKSRKSSAPSSWTCLS